VTVTDGNHCSAADEVTITVNARPEVAIPGSATICVGSSTTLAVAPGFAGYLWSGNSSAVELPVDASGTCRLTVTDEDGCTGVGAFTVAEAVTPLARADEALVGFTDPRPVQLDLLANDLLPAKGSACLFSRQLNHHLQSLGRYRVPAAGLR
jgi:hypothetical protein